jgi:hypothetical protein
MSYPHSFLPIPIHLLSCRHTSYGNFRHFLHHSLPLRLWKPEVLSIPKGIVVAYLQVIIEIHIIRVIEIIPIIVPIITDIELIKCDVRVGFGDFKGRQQVQRIFFLGAAGQVGTGTLLGRGVVQVCCLVQVVEVV